MRFSDTHLPGIDAGTYTLTSELVVKLSGVAVSGSPFTLESKFTVSGERYSVAADQIVGMFPASGGVGDFGTCAPHMLLTRSTLPWERSPYSDGTDAPDASWLALLVFTQAEAPTVQTVQAGSLVTASTGSPWHPAYPLEEGQLATDVVTVIDVPVGLVETLLPVPADLPFIAHVREPLDDDDDPLGQQAVVLGNRLIPPDSLSMIFLVSLEGRYTSAGFDLQGSDSGDLIRLIALKYWRLTSDPSADTFSKSMQALSQADLMPLIPSGALKNPTAMARLEEGFLALPYALRDGSHMPTWYRAPLLCGTDNGNLPAKLPVLSYDALLSYDAANCFFDVTYAAAWALGRALMLASPAVANTLYQWKLTRAQSAQLRAALPKRRHLRTSLGRPALVAESDPLPPTVISWLEAGASLRGVPFVYLVPDDPMLPQESIRFFTLDSCWLRALFDGALSIGRVTAADQAADKNIPLPPDLLAPVTGFLMNSSVVAAFPSLSVTGYNALPNGDPDGVTIDLFRQDLLGKNVLLCLFKGTLEAVDIQPTPAVLHSGVDSASGNLFKLLRDPQTGEILPTKKVEPLPWQGVAIERVLSFHTLAAEMASVLGVAPLTSSGFALQMIQSQFCARLLKTGVEDHS